MIKIIPKIAFSFSLLTLLVLYSFHSQGNNIWPRAQVTPLPDSVQGVANPVISLNGTWKFTLSAPARFWENTVDYSTWDDVKVPDELTIQGYKIDMWGGNPEFPYKKSISIPTDYNDKKIFLRFDGVLSHARVWVNGTYVRSHIGGFTSWDCDITSLVTPGQAATLTVAVRDSFDVAGASGYAHHYIGGILRDVKLFAMPKNYCSSMHVETDFDANYTNATLKLRAEMIFSDATDASIEFSLNDPLGNAVTLSPSSFPFSWVSSVDTISFPISSPMKWDAEHPNLYTFTVKVMSKGSLVQKFSRKIGFRKIEVIGNRVLLNGAELKLRGACMHSIDPHTGRASDGSNAEQDVLLFKKANINFIRTSHYPPHEQFLKMCDKYGMYVEDEAAVCFQYAANDNPALDTAYMGQFSEQLESHRNHPSVIIWSLGNESGWGSNIKLEREYAKMEDPSRPLIFSFSPDTEAETDIESNHYPGLGQNLGNPNKPRLHDEYGAPVNNPPYDEQQRDPGGIRNFWGISVKGFWDKMYTTNGCLGGAIWAAVDDIFFMPNQTAIGYGEWGILDIWRRPKPEYWLTKKGYSPIHISNDTIPPNAGSTISLMLGNRFNHTNMNEVKIKWSLMGATSSSGELIGPSLLPHDSTLLNISVGAYQKGDKLNLQFFTADSIMVDEFEIPIGKMQISFPALSGAVPAITETGSSYQVKGDRFTINFSKTTGLITQAAGDGIPLITGGPRLNLTPNDLGMWNLDSIKVTEESNWAKAVIAGKYGTLPVVFVLKTDSSGLIQTTYTIKGYVTGNTEVGVIFEVPSNVDTITWNRHAIWNFYPADHVGRNSGYATRLYVPAQNQAFGEIPSWSYSKDIKDFYLFSGTDGGNRGTIDFRSSKQNIYSAEAIVTGSNWALRAESDGSDAFRMEKGTISSGIADDRDAEYTGTWTKWSDGPDWSSTETFSNETNAFAEYTFIGSSISWIGTKDVNQGRADVYIDDVLAEQDIDCFHRNGKVYQTVLFSRTGLMNGIHTIKVVVKGTKNSSSADSYITIDEFSTESDDINTTWKMIINNQWSYPSLITNYLGSVTMGVSYSDSVNVRMIPKGVMPVITSTSKSNILNNLSTTSFYPNTATDFITIVTKSNNPISVQVVDINGAVRIQKVISDRQLDVQSLSPGIYILKIDNEFFKLIKQ